jgi:hypothetical protein
VEIRGEIASTVVLVNRVDVLFEKPPGFQRIRYG